MCFWTIFYMCFRIWLTPKLFFYEVTSKFWQKKSIPRRTGNFILDRDGGASKLRAPRYDMHKYFPKLVNPNQILIVITFFRLIYFQSEFRLVPNQSENGDYNPNLVWINNIEKIFLSVWPWYVWGVLGVPSISTLLCRETQSLGQQMLNAPLGINGLTFTVVLLLSSHHTTRTLINILWFSLILTKFGL